MVMRSGKSWKFDGIPFSLSKQEITVNISVKGESNDNLPLRTCPGCSVPEPYWSPDWALVLAKPA
jgi:hypothetical protein